MIYVKATVACDHAGCTKTIDVRCSAEISEQEHTADKVELTITSPSFEEVGWLEKIDFYGGSESHYCPAHKERWVGR